MLYVPRETQRKEDAHHYHETNGIQIMVKLRSLAMNALRLDGSCSITEGGGRAEPRHQGVAGASGLARSCSAKSFWITFNEPPGGRGWG